MPGAELAADIRVFFACKCPRHPDGPNRACWLCRTAVDLNRIDFAMWKPTDEAKAAREAFERPELVT